MNLVTHFNYPTLSNVIISHVLNYLKIPSFIIVPNISTSGIISSAKKSLVKSLNYSLLTSSEMWANILTKALSKLKHYACLIGLQHAASIVPSSHRYGEFLSALHQPVEVLCYICLLPIWCKWRERVRLN